VRSRVANGEKYRPIRCGSFCQGAVAPRLPVYGLLRMLFEIQATRLLQIVLHVCQWSY
jgi:hypothetical protein